MKRVIILILSIFMLTGCIAYQRKAMNDFGADRLEMAIRGLVFIKTEALIKGEMDKETMEAVGIPIGNGLVLGLTHTTKVPSIRSMPSPFGWMIKKIEIIREKWFVGDKEAELLGRKDDISLFRVKGLTQVFPYKFGDSEIVKVGDKVVVSGYPYLKAICVKSGIVANPVHNEVMQYKVPAILMNLALSPGDSGAPVLTEQDGELKIIAIAASKLGHDGIGVAYRIKYVQECIDEILGKTLINRTS